MNPKLQKVNGEIEKTKARIVEQQARLRELEKQRTELENAEIVAIFRKEKLTEGDFNAFIKQMAARPQPEQPDSANTPPTPAYQPKQEDTENEI